MDTWKNLLMIKLDGNCCRKVLLTILCTSFFFLSYADHLKGGWIKYEYVGKSGEMLKYQVTFYQYSDCNEPEKVDAFIDMSVYDGAQLYKNYQINQSSLVNETKNNFGPCFDQQPYVCYLIASYSTTISLPANSAGYTLSVQRCCRIAGIENVPNSNTYGLTYTATIPGGLNSDDDSPDFGFNETVAICANSPFSIDLSASDNNHDSLSYTLCSGLTGGSLQQPFVDQPPAPPYALVQYNQPYSGAEPLGNTAALDPLTGIYAGIAPDNLGTYVVAVCVNEYRQGVYIGHTRKEIHFNVENCKLGGAHLNPTYVNCDSFNFQFANESFVPGYSYLWDFGVTSLTTDTSSSSYPSYTYPDTGTYTVKLKVDNNKGCQDSATTQVKIYPGFNTDFSIEASCIKNPYEFTDLSTTRYGYISNWDYNIEDYDTSDQFAFIHTDTNKNVTYNFLDTGLRKITLISASSKGCIDTSVKQLHVTPGPDLSLKFLDTLICTIDTLQLQASSADIGAKFNWTPLYNISDPSSPVPFISPQKTTVYNLSVMYKGCETNDSVTVNVTDRVDLSLPGDTTICQTDSIALIPTSNALYYNWSPSEGLSSINAKVPDASPLNNTNYSLVASIGKCSAKAAIALKVVPYPVVDAGNDLTICYGKPVQLNASIKAAYFTWSPTSSLFNYNTLSPFAGPLSTTNYFLQVSDTLGCPKLVTDSILVNVIPKVQVNITTDTNVVSNQPIQLNANGGDYYEWTPSTYLNNPLIQNPIAILPAGVDTITYKVKAITNESCVGYDSIKIFAFETQPMVFVPTAFTPNHDGLNDVIKPTIAGMQKFLYFNIYNRYGDLLYTTSTENEGWNGIYKGKPQASGTYVYTIAAIDYKGKNYFSKGTFVLIR